jgi:hypothetical protein
MRFFSQSIKIKDLLIVLSITIILLVIFEFLSEHILSNKKSEALHQTFKRQYHGNNLDFLNKCCSYDEVDPLLGWAMSEEKLAERGWKLKNNCICLENVVADSKDTLVIFITGGSTSDLGLNPKNWPLLLHRKLKEKHIASCIYVGAVGAYSSSQEVLKLLRDGISIHPDIHISYCGANEYQNPYFVSPYEQTFFKEALHRAQSAPLLPNTVYLLKSLLNTNKNAMTLKAYPIDNAFQQWKENLATMQAISIGNNYTFIGILQPVVGFGKITDTKKDPDIQPLLEEYRKFYPLAIQHAEAKDYLIDYTSIFDDIGDKAFVDDCHLKDEYQQRVADSIFSLIGKKIL